LLLIGPGAAGEAMADAARARDQPVFHGRLVPDPRALEPLKGTALLAFAGIGDPEKFFATLQDAGLDVRERRSFPDHHRFHRAEALDLIARAERDGLALVTTEKDLARLVGQDDVKALAGIARALPVSLVIAEQVAFRSFVLARVG
jgi:tetraacyldisaccharide 4'-kinase